MTRFFGMFGKRPSHLAMMLGCAVLAAALTWLCGAARPLLFESLEVDAIDLRFRLRPPLSVSDNPAMGKSDRLIAIDYDDHAARAYGLGRWPWDRRVHAELFDLLKNAGARVVMIDLLFDHPSDDPNEDQALIDASRRSGTIIYPVVLQPATEFDPADTLADFPSQHLLHGHDSGTGELLGVGDAVLPLPTLMASAGAIGHIQRTPDASGGLRRVPLLYAVKGGFVPALSFAAALRLLDVVPSSLRIERGNAIRFKPRRGEEVVIPLDAQGRTWINYAGPWGSRFIHYPYSWILDQLNSPRATTKMLKRFKGRSVIISNLTTGSGDRVMTPFEPDFPTSEVALHLLNSVLNRQFLREATPLEMIFCFAIPLALLAATAFAGGPAVIIPAFVVVLGSDLAVLQLAFNHGVILPAAAPLVALAMALVLLLAARFFIVDRERTRFQTVLGACLPPQTMQVIQENPGRIPSLLAGHSRELTIFFADIQGFSGFCKRADPLEIQQVLRDYLTGMTAILRQRGGTLDKYMGDGIMAFFGDADPEDSDPDAEETRVERQAANAVRAGLEMQHKMAELNRGWSSLRREPHQIRIGINTGVVTVGNLGTEFLWDYTVIGPEVNKAQRLERAAEPGGLLIARRTYLLARNHGVLPDGLPSKVIALKGMGDEGHLYAVSSHLVGQLTAAPPATYRGQAG